MEHLFLGYISGLGVGRDMRRLIHAHVVSSALTQVLFNAGCYRSDAGVVGWWRGEKEGRDGINSAASLVMLSGVHSKQHGL
jgi:hypothetical protein